MPGVYQTKQKDIISACMTSHPKKLLSAKEIHAICEREGTPVSLVTIYRQLEQLMQEGKVKKVVTSDSAGIRFQYAPDSAAPDAFYLKCDRCGELTQMDCGLLHEVADHMNAEHGFQIDAAKSVLYGRCQSCKAR